jgi:hypothetical protein
VSAVGTKVSSAYGPLETGTDPSGPTATLTVTGNKALVILTAQISGSTGQTAGFMNVEVDGVLPSNDANSLRVFGNDPVRASSTALVTGLTPNVEHVFTAVYRNVGSGSSTFSARTITVIPG